MRIYNEIVTIFNENTGLWETISEDSFNYNGPMAMAAGMPPNASQINTSDTIADTRKVTAGYFTSGDGTLGGSQIYTASFYDKFGVQTFNNDKYYFNVLQDHPTSSAAEVQFSVTYGHVAGSGSDNYGDGASPNTLYSETQAIYSQFTGLLLEATETSDGFQISSAGSHPNSLGTGVKDPYFYALIGKRNRFKDRINKKAWTMLLSGSSVTGTGSLLHLTDDSRTVPAIATPGGPRYNIVSGTIGQVSGSGASYQTFGHFYPEMGIMLFSGHELGNAIPGPHDWNAAGTPHVTASHGSHYYSSIEVDFTDVIDVGDYIKICSSGSIDSNGCVEMYVSGGDPGAGVDNGFTGSLSWPFYGPFEASISSGSMVYKSDGTQSITASFSRDNVGTRYSSSGFIPNHYAKGNSKNALRLVNCMANVNGTTLRLRSEEDQTQENYFCRIKAAEYNFSANHSYVSGSKNKILNLDMHGDPHTFITGIGLYNSAGQLLAIAKLSKPLLKNFAAEATVKVKLTY